MVTTATECIGPYIARAGTDVNFDLPGRGPGGGVQCRAHMCISASSLVPGLDVLLEWRCVTCYPRVLSSLRCGLPKWRSLKHILVYVFVSNHTYYSHFVCSGMYQYVSSAYVSIRMYHQYVLVLACIRKYLQRVYLHASLCVCMNLYVSSVCVSICMYLRYCLLMFCSISSDATIVSQEMGGHLIIRKGPIPIGSMVSNDNGLYWYVSACIACVYVCMHIY